MPGLSIDFDVDAIEKHTGTRLQAGEMNSLKAIRSLLYSETLYIGGHRAQDILLGRT
jgi:hypothetical protein